MLFTNDVAKIGIISENCNICELNFYIGGKNNPK